MNRRHFLSCLALAPVAGVLSAPPSYEIVGCLMVYSDGRIFDWKDLRWQERPTLHTAAGIDKYELPRTAETRQVFTTHNVSQPDAYRTEHQIVFDGTEWVDV